MNAMGVARTSALLHGMVYLSRGFKDVCLGCLVQMLLLNRLSSSTHKKANFDEEQM